MKMKVRKMERTIRVTGKGKLAVKPDTIRLRLNMEGMSKEYDETLKVSTEHTECQTSFSERS